MLKYVSKFGAKFALEILPSVAATIIGAYIVNHYIVTKPAADAPVAAALSTTDPKAEAKAEAKAASQAAKADTKASETSSDVANIPEAGVKAKGISEKAVLERSADKPAGSASVPADTRRHQPLLGEKSAARTVAVPPPAVAPVVTAPNPAPAVEAASTSEERRDANDLARAAIERLRGSNDNSPRAQEAARVPEAPRVVSVPAVRPLPPPILVSTPSGETFDPTGSLSAKPPYAARADDPHRPTPPADIPVSRPLDLRAEATVPAAREHTSVAEDVLTAAKSMFHAVLPK